MEGLNLSNIPIDLLLNILNIVLLFLIVRKLAYKPVRKFMDARTARVTAAANEAAEKAAAADAAKAEYDALLQSAQTQCDRAVDDARRNAKAESENVLRDAREQAQLIVAQADEQANRTRQDALKNMQSDVVELAFDISEKLLERSVRDADTQKLADRLFESCTGGENNA